MHLHPLAASSTIRAICAQVIRLKIDFSRARLNAGFIIVDLGSRSNQDEICRRPVSNNFFIYFGTCDHRIIVGRVKVHRYLQHFQEHSGE